MSSNQKIALVTGGSRGIGREIALKLAKNGYYLIINYLSSKESAQELLAQTKGEIIQANVSDPEDRKKLVSLIKNKFNKLDLLVNNAGITRDNLLIRMSPKEWKQVLETNLLSVIDLTEELLEFLQKIENSKIVNISSTVGVHGNPGQSNYSTAKAGLLTFTRLKARELISKIQVNCIAPGLVQTSMTEDFDLEELAKTKIKRAIQPGEIAELVLYLSKADSVTGQVFELDRGLSLLPGLESLS